ncbi:type VI secretion system tip protein VgrG [Chitinophaga agrisoli]|uniref:Type VI secretion system tip protein VgrG n=1 Tax=Chitinophaga agrisoli TaxID=2607653 RepID=A0A5B2VJL8_9BACT|nr:type VI secretion system tip protein VgrG [Chitinophaga agrisoli]KAA2239281.1 type VI secretion system tip protein VgrG [Chitinophaga agrisoli]
MTASLDSLTPGTERSRTSITRKVFINGTVLSNEIRLSQITVNRSFNKIAYARLVFADGSAANRDFPLSNDDKFKPGNEIRVQLGYEGSADTIFEGIIVKHGIKVTQQGSSLLLIEAKDKAIKLTATRKHAYHINKSDSDVISELASGGSLTPDVESTNVPHKQLVQFDATDWDFIVTRAEANGMLVLTDDGKLVAKKPSTTAPPVVTATFGSNIWEFEADMDARRQVQAVTAHSWDYTKQEPETSEAGTATFTENGNIPSSELGGVLGAELQLSHPGHLTQQQLQSWSDAVAMRNHLSKAIGRVRIAGNATVKPGSMITLAGVGDRFNGNVFVTGVLHHFEGNWQTDIQFGWRDDWFYKKENVMDKPAAGLLPGVSGLQIGTVVDLDDQEEGGQYRVKVHIPSITSGNEGIWARVATLDAGANRGVYFRPQVTDEVVLGFLNDDPREPVIVGYLHSKDSKQSPLPEQSGSLQYGFVTEQGIKLVFDDTNKRLTVLVPTGSGEKSLIINDASGAMELKDEHQNSIKMNAQGITIQAGANVVIKGTQVMIN